MKTLLQSALLSLIRFYKKTEPMRVEFARNLHLPVHSCRFQPTCSEYAMEAVEKYGAFRGGAKAVKRIVRCGPWSRGGYDPVQ